MKKTLLFLLSLIADGDKVNKNVALTRMGIGRVDSSFSIKTKFQNIVHHTDQSYLIPYKFTL